MSDIDDGMKQWEPEPPPEGGYEVDRIHPYGEDAEDFVDSITSLARHEPNMAGITAAGVGFPLDDREVTAVQLGGLRHDGHGNLILERRERRKEVVEAERKARGERLIKGLDDLLDQINRQNGEDASEQAETG